MTKPHIVYACVGIFSTIFSLVSLFVKERLFIGEATVATIAGLILGPHCLGWIDPVSWGNSDLLTLEFSRIVLCIQIVAVAVELPKKYMKNHWVSVAIFLLPVMTAGWLIVGLFIWVLIPHFNFSDALLISACVTATDPILAAAVVGKGKFAERVPGHLRNLLSAESGCNDGMAFPFIFLALNMVLHPGDPKTIVKNWFLLTILWECMFGIVLGVFLGYVLRKMVAFAEKQGLIDRESFLALFVFLAFNCAGIGSMLGVDDLLVSFAAGTAFGWNGDFSKKTEESHVSTVIDLLLNLTFFIYFGAIIPWPQFNDSQLGMDIWRLIVLAIVVIFLRRIPAVLAFKPFTPDLKSWREALFCGHFGPIGVGAVFASILARSDLEGHYTDEETPLYELPDSSHPHYQLLVSIWPMVCFIVITSIIVHGSSVAVLTLGKRLNRMAITMSFTATNTQDGSHQWMNRLQMLDKVTTSFSLHRMDTHTPSVTSEQLDEKYDFSQDPNNKIETSGIKVRPAGGARRRKLKKKKKASKLKKTLSRVASTSEDEVKNKPDDQRIRPQPEVLQLGGRASSQPILQSESIYPSDDDHPVEKLDLHKTRSTATISSKPIIDKVNSKIENDNQIPTTAYQEGSNIVIEDQHGEIVETVKLDDKPNPRLGSDNESEHSMSSLERHLTQYSELSAASESLTFESRRKSTSSANEDLKNLKKIVSKRAYRRKEDHKRVYAHQIDDLIFIENEDGDIIRRYKVNRHTSRPRSGSIVSKALKMVGINSSKSKENPGIKPSKSQAEQLTLPENPHTLTVSDSSSRSMDDAVVKKLNDALQSPTQKVVGVDSSLSNSKVGSNYYDHIDDDALSESSDQSVSSELNQDYESTVERNRRLQALGKFPSKREPGDEES